MQQLTIAYNYPMHNMTTPDNKARLLLDGHETFSAVKDALEHARHCINLEYFSFRDDETGRAIAGILAERSRNGVKVRMITDALGSWRLGRKFIHGLVSSGVEFRRFMPLTIHRDHRKIITVDGVTGFLGGFNIGDVYLRDWRDTHLQLEGDSVRELDRIFSGMWRLSGGNDTRDFPDHEGAGITGSVPVRIVAGGEGGDFRAVHDEYMRIISRSRKRIWITTPYFAPDSEFIDALCHAVERGVNVRIIIPSSSNHALVSWASQSYIDGLISHGVRVFIYVGRFIHAKTMLADSHVASVGTANLDALSFGINYEVQAFVYSTELVRELEGVFLEDLGSCTEETLETRADRPAMLRLKERIGRLLSFML